MSVIGPDAVFRRALPAETPTQLVHLLAEARAALKTDPDAADDWLARCEVLLRTVATPTDAPPVPGSGGLAPWQAVRIKRHIDANLRARLSNAELAAVLGLSEIHFARVFKATIGCPPHAYVIRRRIVHAKLLLIDTEARLCDIALDCGLADQAHFSRLFRRLVGATPSAWRRHHGAGAGREHQTQAQAELGASKAKSLLEPSRSRAPEPALAFV